MERTLRLLRIFYFTPVIVSLAIVFCFETDFFVPGGLYDEYDKGTEFAVTTVMELLSICAIPLALRLFRFRRIKRALPSNPEKLLFYGGTRLLLIMIPMTADTLLYYLYVSAAFGYLALILLLSSVFVYPSASRCKSEIQDSGKPQ